MTQLSLFAEVSKKRTEYQGKTQLIEDKFASKIREELGLGKLVSYVGNKNLPILRLYRYKEAFAFSLVREFINRFNLTENDYIFEPFSGMGTTLFTAMQHNIPSIGIDKLPISRFIANTLPLFCLVKPTELQTTFTEIKNKINKAELAEIALDVKIMKMAFREDIMINLRQLKTVIDELEYPLKDIFLLLFFAILEPCSYTAKDGQFLRMQKAKNIPLPIEILQQKVQVAEQDIVSWGSLWKGDKKLPNVYLGDARDLSNINFVKKPTAIITSPPYPNRYDYTRTYVLELCFHFVKNFEELKELRFGILRSHIESKISDLERPNHPVIAEVIKHLNEGDTKLNNPRIPAMLTAYFIDMEKVIKEWYKVLANGGKVAMVVDNVRFGGEMIPVDLILSEMAENIGFKIEEIITARYKGNSSQQMGKYGRIPVRESILIWSK